MFVGPWNLGGEWSDSGIVGLSRWLNRVWALCDEPYVPRTVDAATDTLVRHIMHKTIKAVSADLEDFRFNTMLARLMEFTNVLGPVQDAGSISASTWQEAIRILLLLTAPSAPHITEELWASLGYPYSIHNQRWPSCDEELAREDVVTVAVQVNGKLRDKLVVPADISESEVTCLALASERIKTYTDSKPVRKVIYVPGRIVSIVV